MCRLRKIKPFDSERRLSGVIYSLIISFTLALSASALPGHNSLPVLASTTPSTPVSANVPDTPTPRIWANGEYIISCDDGNFDANTPEVAIAPPGSPWAGSMHAVWAEKNNSVVSPYVEIHYSKSEAADAGRQWSNDEVSEGDRLISQDYVSSSSNPGIPGDASKPSIAIDQMGWIHVVWAEQYPDLTYEIHYSRSVDNGHTWTAHDQRDTFGDILVSSRNGNNAALINRPQIAVTDSPLTLHVVWDEVNSNGDATEIWYAKSTFPNQGNAWASPVQISMPSAPTDPDAGSPDIAVSGPGNSIVHVVWTQNFQISQGVWASDVFYTRSPNNGMNWEPERHISQILPNTFAAEAQITAIGTNVHVIWQQTTLSGSTEIYYSGSQNNGLTWSGDGQDIIISHPDGQDASESIVSCCAGPGGPEVHAVWVERDQASPFNTKEVHYSMSDDPFYPQSWTGSSQDIVVSHPDTDDSEHPAMAAGTVGGKVKAQIFWQEDIDLNDKASKNIEIHYLPDMTFDIPVHIGWNFISVPLIQGNTSILTVLDDSQGDGATNWSSVKYYSNDGAQMVWKSYNKAAPAELRTLSDIDHKMGIWVYITSLGDGNLTVYGDYGTSARITLKAGWNMVGYPAQTSKSITDSLGSINDLPVEGYDSNSTYYISQFSGSHMMIPGEGYWVHVSSDTVWTVNW